MNLELLDPFGRQVPDRVDATLQLPDAFHPLLARDPHDDEWRAAYHVAFNRRGTYVAVGYGSGVAAVYSTLNRTLVALYPHHSPYGCSGLSWSRRSRLLLAGAAGEAAVRFYDASHPYGPEEASSHLLSNASNRPAKGPNDDDEDGGGGGASQQPRRKQSKKDSQSVPAPYPANEIPPDHLPSQTKHLPFRDIDQRYKMVKDTRNVPALRLNPGGTIPKLPRPTPAPAAAAAAAAASPEATAESNDTAGPSATPRFPCVQVELPCPAGGSVQINPRRPNCALAVLQNGSLVLIWIPETAFAGDHECPTALIYTLYEPAQHEQQQVTCAAFDPYGGRVYAATDRGRVLGFRVSHLWQDLARPGRPVPPRPRPGFDVAVGGAGGAASSSSGTVWHLLVSRNGKFLVLNSADGAIRLYNATNIWKQKKKKRAKASAAADDEDEDEDDATRPVHVFQDVVTKVKFASTDLSGDGEYVVGGANGADSKYELYIWNTSTGALMDKLTGQSTQLYAVAWHPTRTFLAVACADGIVDVWAPRINWTAYAPDFQALPMNVEYIEREDEFDVDERGRHLAAAADDAHADAPSDPSSGKIDVTTIDPVPVFASDSEDEEDVFYFETKLRNALSGFKTVAKKRTADGDD